MARTYRVTIKAHHAGGILIEPGLHYQTDLATGGGEPDPLDLLNHLWGQWDATLRPCFHNSIVVDELIATEEVLSPDVGVAAVLPLNSPGTLAGVDQTLPHGAVPVVNLHTNTRSRSARGWLMMASPMGTANVSGDAWTPNSAFMVNLRAWAATLATSFDLGTFQPAHVNPVVYSRTRRQRNTPPFTFRLTSATVNPQVRWLKSRLTNP